MVVVGDGAGNVGSGLGKAGAVPDAVRKGTSVARKDMHPVKLIEATIPHEMVAKFGAAKVLLMPAAPGTGIIAGGGVRAVMEAAGVKDVLSKTYGSSNTINIVKATMRALDQMRDPVAETRRRRNFAAPPPPVYTSSVPAPAVMSSVSAPAVSIGARSHATRTGARSHAVRTGARSHATRTGARSHATRTGARSHVHPHRRP